MTLVNWNEVFLELKKILASAGDGLAVDDEALASYRPRYNIAPEQLHLFLRNSSAGARIGLGRWGLPARGPDKPPLINVRAETVAIKPVFQQALASRRCVIPADGYLEWKSGPGGRQPMWFHRPDGKLLLLAGLFDEEPPSAEFSTNPRFAVLTTAANKMVSAFHHRMPVLLTPEEASIWLAQPDPGLMRTAREDLLVATPVSVRVNSIRHDDPDCLGPPRNVQLSLF